jgi:Fe-S cluster biosynthesis and repair protein YggX
VVDITYAKQINKKLGDGSIFENISKNKWVSLKELRNILLNKKYYYLSSLSSAYLLFNEYLK